MMKNTKKQNHTFCDDSLSFILLFGVYAGSISVCSAHGTKLVALGPFVFDAGLITYALPFLVTDICSEIFGTRYSKKIIFGGFIALLVSFLTTYVSLSLPGASQWQLTQEYNAVFGTGFRIMLATIATFVVSQLVDIYVFKWFKHLTKGKYLWLRNNASTMAGGLVDAIIFNLIAFYGVYDITPIIVSAYIIRLMISLLDTPIVYLGVWVLKKTSHDAA